MYDSSVNGTKFQLMEPIKPIPNATHGGITIINFGIGKSERCLNHGFIIIHHTKGRTVPWKVRRIKKKQTW